MVKRPALGLLVLVGTLVPLAGFAQEDDLQWIGDASEYGASLIYGVPETSYAPIAFWCEPEAARVIFTHEHEPADAEDGMEVTVWLQTGDIEIAITTTGMRLDMDDLFILEGEVMLDEQLADLLTSEGTLFVRIGDGVAEFPLDGAREAAKPLMKSCAAF